jgi:hypothetical protein
MLAALRHWSVCTTLIAASLGSGLLAGCGSKVDAGTVQVEGTVTVDDKPISMASVAFIGKEGARLASTTTDSAGKFKIRAAEGKNVVTVAKAPPGGAAPPPSDEPQLMPSEGEYIKMQKAVAASEVPEKYGDPKTSGLSFDVAAGMKSVDVALSSK